MKTSHRPDVSDLWSNSLTLSDSSVAIVTKINFQDIQYVLIILFEKVEYNC